MKALAAGSKREVFWVLFGSLLFYVAAYFVASFLLTTNRPFWFLYWKNLPLLPNVEKAVGLDEVRFRDSIDVLTDHGNAFRCRFLVPGNCWIPIPVENALVEPRLSCEKLPHSGVPFGARASYLACDEHAMRAGVIFFFPGMVIGEIIDLFFNRRWQQWKTGARERLNP